MSIVRFSLGLGELTATKGEDESPTEAVARSIARRVGAHSVRLNQDSRAMDGSFENFSFVALGRFDKQQNTWPVLDSGSVTIFRAEPQRMTRL